MMLHLIFQIAKAMEAPPGAVHVWLVFPNLCWKLCLHCTFSPSCLSAEGGNLVLGDPKAKYGPTEGLLQQSGKYSPGAVRC